MKNYEKYADKIMECKGTTFCKDFIMPCVLESEDCDIDCAKCRMLQVLWLLEDYEEPETDWSKVEVDTPILVRDFEGSDWFRRHFAKYENGTVYAWDGGDTSWSGEDIMTDWKYAKLAESEEE